jgi:hypothetical protein
MANEKETGKIPTRKLPEFKIRKSQIRDMKAAAKILEMLSDKPDVLKKISNEFMKAARAPEEDMVATSYEAKESMIDILSENLKDIPEDVIEKNMDIIWGHIPHIWYDTPQLWYKTPHIWHNTWRPIWENTPVWEQGPGPIEGKEPSVPEGGQYRRRYRW